MVTLKNMHADQFSTFRSTANLMLKKILCLRKDKSINAQTGKIKNKKSLNVQTTKTLHFRIHYKMQVKTITKTNTNASQRFRICLCGSHPGSFQASDLFMKGSRCLQCWQVKYIKSYINSHKFFLSIDGQRFTETVIILRCRSKDGKPLTDVNCITETSRHCARKVILTDHLNACACLVNRMWLKLIHHRNDQPLKTFCGFVLVIPLTQLYFWGISFLLYQLLVTEQATKCNPVVFLESFKVIWLLIILI